MSHCICRKHTEKLFTKTRIRILQLYVCGHTILIYNDNFTNNGHYNKLCLDEQWKSWKIITFNFSHENFSIWTFSLFDLAESNVERAKERETESPKGHLKLISLVVRTENGGKPSENNHVIHSNRIHTYFYFVCFWKKV